MMGCAHCDGLRRQVRELQEELAEWRLRDHVAASATDVQIATLVRQAVKVLKVDLKYFGPAEFRVLLALLEASPNICRHMQLFTVAIRGVESDTNMEIVKVRISRLRRLLRGAGFVDVIETYWGQGYRIAPARASAIRAWLADLEAGARAARDASDARTVAG